MSITVASRAPPRHLLLQRVSQPLPRAEWTTAGMSDEAVLPLLRTMFSKYYAFWHYLIRKGCGVCVWGFQHHLVSLRNADEYPYRL